MGRNLKFEIMTHHPSRYLSLLSRSRSIQVCNNIELDIAVGRQFEPGPYLTAGCVCALGGALTVCHGMLFPNNRCGQVITLLRLGTVNTRLFH